MSFLLFSFAGLISIDSRYAGLVGPNNGLQAKSPNKVKYQSLIRGTHRSQISSRKAQSKIQGSVPE
jgi:hypothetical protein